MIIAGDKVDGVALLIAGLVVGLVEGLLVGTNDGAMVGDDVGSIKSAVEFNNADTLST